jgi:hypothetical protein
MVYATYRKCKQHETLKLGLKRSEEEKENLMTRYRCKNVISNLQDFVAHLSSQLIIDAFE